MENITKAQIFDYDFNLSDKYGSEKFESRVSGLFSDIWLDMTDEIYFDQTYEKIHKYIVRKIYKTQSTYLYLYSSELQ